MIIVGTYPDFFDENDSSSKLVSLGKILEETVPKGVCLHILPLYPNSGDFGFAPNDWFKIREGLGTWEEFSHLAKSWNIIVDGIYNHVGLDHKWVQGFLSSPEHYKDIVHAIKTSSIHDGPISPRGQPVLTESVSGFFLWKTFSDAAVDIRLESHIVQKEIDTHLNFLASLGVWGIRLDAVAYYAKALGKRVRHNPGVYELADMMADKVRSRGLKVLPQLDCDEKGVTYYSDETRKDIPLNDFTYSTYLALSLLDGDPSILIKHVARTQETGRTIIRSPRTHDGILLRSRLLGPDARKKIINFAQDSGMKIRTNGGEPYEINVSAPYLYTLIAPEVDYSKTILLILAVTGMISGWSYFYFPSIIGQMPESSAKQEDFNDPRALNRLPASKLFLEEYRLSAQMPKVAALLSLLNKIHLEQGNDFSSNSKVLGELLFLTTPDSKYELAANFSKTKSVELHGEWSGESILDYNDFEEKRLGTFGYVIRLAGQIK